MDYINELVKIHLSLNRFNKQRWLKPGVLICGQQFSGLTMKLTENTEFLFTIDYIHHTFFQMARKRKKSI